uniref:VWFC domain-containing protein n=1 Tax=Caenorhabditis tropicalis TaxID=1561998 RepID=A0A1I7U0K4_9PELO
MWVHHLVIPLLLISAVKCEIDRSPSMLVHYMNLLSIGESWIAITFDLNANGTFFLGKNAERRLEVGFRNKTLYMILPISSSRIQHNNKEKRYAIDFDSIGKVGPSLELIITFQHNHIHVYDVCDEIFAGFEPDLMLSLAHVKVKVVENWQGPQPSHFAIGSGWPIGQKCRLNGVKKKYAQSYSEEIEKGYQPSSFNDMDEIFFEQVVIAPPNFNGCKINNALLHINETRTLDCNICTCLDRDEVTCRALECPAVTCEHPMTRKGDCCPTCGEQCFYENHKIANPHDTQHVSLPVVPRKIGCTMRNSIAAPNVATLHVFVHSIRVINMRLVRIQNGDQSALVTRASKEMARFVKILTSVHSLKMPGNSLAVVWLDQCVEIFLEATNATVYLDIK